MMKLETLVSRKTAVSALKLAGVLLLAACATTSQRAEFIPPVFPPAPDEPRFYYERTIYSTADVAKKDRNADLKRALTGQVDLGDGMTKPYGVAVYHGRVFVSDSAGHAVVAFDIPGQRAFRIGDGGEGALTMPLGLDVDGVGNVYVVDASTKLVQVFDKDGKHLKTMGGKRLLSRPSGIAVDEAGKRVYVVDTGAVTNEKHRVVVFDGESGKHLFDIGKRGSAEGEFNLPRDVAIGTDGLLYVVDGGNFRVQVFKPDGTFVRTFGSIGRQAGQFSRPKEVAVDPEGHVYVIDSAFGNFQIFNTQGDILLAVGGRSETDAPAKYMLPSGIAIDGDGRVYMVDQYFRKVEVYRPAKLAADGGFTLKAAPAAGKGSGASGS
ncbi:MAG TPA: 6-bladed beta-propeller [Noviherbaspirillum sp.]